MVNGMSKSRGSRRRLTRLAVGGLLVVVVAAGSVYLWGDALVASGSSDGPAFRTAQIERGNVDATVNASGSLKARITVEVGAQVTGQIRDLLVDYNSRVKRGDVLARIDPQPFEARVVEARADLKVAEATVGMQAARIVALTAETRAAVAALSAARRAYDRRRNLLAKRITSRADYDKALQEYERARANLAAARAKEVEQRAQLRIARAQVEQRKAVLQQREIDLAHTVIRAPVAGIVIARQVDKGQTVSAATTAPTLFRIAGDLTRMQVEVGVDEADIGRIQEGQKTSFTVDTFPGQRFPGTVIQVRKEPKEVQSVVTYTVMISADNPDNRLLPGMTANVTFFVSQRRNVLKVSNAALRFRPPGAAAPGRPGRPSPQMLKAMREAQKNAWNRVVKRLGLTMDQQKRIRALEAELRDEMRKVFRGMAMSPDPKRLRSVVREMRKRRRTGILQILKPAQREKYAAMEAERRNRHVRPATLYRIGANGQPEPVPILIGATDGAFTEIVAATVKEGDSVISGIRRAVGRSGRTSRPRF